MRETEIERDKETVNGSKKNKKLQLKQMSETIIVVIKVWDSGNNTLQWALFITLLVQKIISQVQCHVPVVPATGETKAEESLESVSWRPLWAIQQDLISRNKTGIEVLFKQ
jgi:hypothetical protein